MGQELGQEPEAGNSAVHLIATGKSVRISGHTSGELITIHAVADRDPKRRGEATEAEFVARATGLNFRVAKPWGDSEPYDILIGFGRGFWRVQVKLASDKRRGQYLVRARRHTGPYTKDNIDFIAAHVARENIWYVVPVEAFEEVTRFLHFNPQSRRQSKYEKYREAWCLLACGPKARGWKDIPMLCRCKELPVRCAVCPRRP
jgi:hypothetical protein